MLLVQWEDRVQSVSDVLLVQSVSLRCVIGAVGGQSSVSLSHVIGSVSGSQTCYWFSQ